MLFSIGYLILIIRYVDNVKKKLQIANLISSVCHIYLEMFMLYRLTLRFDFNID